MSEVDTVFLNGTVGVGKSTVADALADLEEQAAIPHAVIDLDHIRHSWPAPADDPFNLALELANLAAIATNYRAAGAKRLILAGVIERREDVARYRDATHAQSLAVIRLTLDPALTEERLRSRHANDPEGLAWHLARVTELAALLETADIDDAVIDTSGLTPARVAAEVQRTVGWR
ncbi:AAA family ATPase [Nocardia sp. IFM 10818]